MLTIRIRLKRQFLELYKAKNEDASKLCVPSITELRFGLLNSIPSKPVKDQCSGGVAAPTPAMHNTSPAYSGKTLGLHQSSTFWLKRAHL